MARHPAAPPPPPPPPPRTRPPPPPPSPPHPPKWHGTGRPRPRIPPKWRGTAPMAPNVKAPPAERHCFGPRHPKARPSRTVSGTRGRSPRGSGASGVSRHRPGQALRQVAHPEHGDLVLPVGHAHEPAPAQVAQAVADHLLGAQP